MISYTYTIVAKPIKTPELHYPMIKIMIQLNVRYSSLYRGFV